MIELIKLLRQNSRKTISEMHDITGISLCRINAFLENNPVVKKYSTLLDFEKLGLHVRVHIFVSADGVRNFLAGSANVNSLYALSDDWDYFCEAIFYDLLELYEFLDCLENIGLKNIQVFHTMPIEQELFLR